ncbi:hypothetical protein EGT07_05260 [Herbaspirillum sp. HC18]|nr:hypothetical protein EGT07_05260 [Herbaspirillum sp. HC18]
MIGRKNLWVAISIAFDPRILSTGFVMSLLLAGCSSMDDMSAEDRAQKNLCEAMRSYRPYYPDDCTTKPYTCQGCGMSPPQDGTSSGG